MWALLMLSVLATSWHLHCECGIIAFRVGLIGKNTYLPNELHFVVKSAVQHVDTGPTLMQHFYDVTLVWICCVTASHDPLGHVMLAASVG